MSATSKTPNFNLPLYNLNDTIAFIPDWNDLATDVDNNMQINKTLSNQNSTKITEIENEIDTINNKLNSINTNFIKYNVTNIAGITEVFQNKDMVVINCSGKVLVSEMQKLNENILIAQNYPQLDTPYIVLRVLNSGGNLLTVDFTKTFSTNGNLQIDKIYTNLQNSYEIQWYSFNIYPLIIQSNQ